MNVIQYKALLKTSVRLTCGEYHGTEHDPTSNQKVLDKGQEFEDHRIQIAGKVAKSRMKILIKP